MDMYSTRAVGHPDTPEREQAARVRARADQRYQAIRGRDDLSDLGKQANLAAVHLRTKAKLAELQQSEQDRRAAERQDAENDLFNVRPGQLTGADAIAARDASDRAAQLTTPSKASSLLDQATRNHDQQLAGAVARHALNNGWRGVVAEYVGDDPDKQAAYDSIREHKATVDTPQDRMTRQMIFNAGAPRELIGVPQSKVQALADQVGQTE